MTADASIKIGAIIPLSGPAGLFGPSCCNCFSLAAADVNDAGGILGRKVNLVFIDGGQKPGDVAQNIRTLLDLTALSGLIGMHDSDVRAAVCEAAHGRVPYVYTPTYEGGEHRGGVFYLGETPQQQLAPVFPWLMDRCKLKRWWLIGNDYSWPRKLHALARHYICQQGGSVIGEHYVPLGTEDFTDYVESLQGGNADAVMVALVGSDSANFNRAFAEAGLLDRIRRFSPLLEENTLLAIGADATQGLYTASSYFTSIPEATNQAFLAKYAAAYGEDAPVVTTLAQSCYEGLLFLKYLARRAQSLDPSVLTAASEGFSYESPRGTMRMVNGHLVKSIYLAAADDLDFRIITVFKDVLPQ